MRVNTDKFIQMETLGFYEGGAQHSFCTMRMRKCAMNDYNETVSLQKVTLASKHFDGKSPFVNIS